MRAGFVGSCILVTAACGRSGFMGGDDDVTPNAIDWIDFTNVSSAQAISDIDLAIDLEITAAYGSGTPTIEYRVNGGAWIAFSPQSAGAAAVVDGDALQFRVSGTLNQSAVITVRNRSDGSTVLDTAVGIVAAEITGSGVPGAPYAVPGVAPASCADFLKQYEFQAGLDGLYTIDPGTRFDAFCDMTTDNGGWTLVARVLETSTTHTTAAAIDTIVDPTQLTTAKLADATINVLGFSHARITIEGVGTVYANVISLDLAGTEFTLVNSAAPALAGPYSYDFLTQVGCSSDCGVDVVRPNIGFGNNCGYRYFSSTNNPRPGMGCQGNFGKRGTLWVQ